ncbi:zinc phosphodiesterase ELAC protein 1 [Corythoichthys intestinalis]|uniref:zinc phosphodiesterase ELAC protein 1 n=1 Tax=Corythoichthys intestinalis TaxID=161448 RepID=UPI0025A4F35A|nr:zinc phosphodiesterase ELAC protein 1 [Corythoichthys intestinalis]XP_061804694.1 zinc phosphodiesterase ELAC protein 1-like [Nerophis lumbriciformis]
MSMDLTFLGTGSAYPSPHRGASALVLRNDGDCWLFDCGEGTQTQLMKSPIRAGRISKVFISHLHGDHLFGLPGLLCTVSLNLTSDSRADDKCVEVFGPRGLRRFLRVSLGLTGSQLLFPYAVHELEPTLDQSPEEGQLSLEMTAANDPPLPQERPGRNISLDTLSDAYFLFEDDKFVVKAFRLFHRVPSFGFCVHERDRPGRLKTELLKEIGLNPGPAYGRLKAGHQVQLENGQVISPAEFLDENIPGRKVCILGDCSSALSSGLNVCQGADLLVHEATLGEAHRDKAAERGHSTPRMAAELARACGARRLALYHFSQRYKPEHLHRDGDDDDKVSELRRQAEEVLCDDSVEVILAEDFLTIDIPLRASKSSR